MESERHCPACLKPFEDTNKLLCGHVFCSKCVSKTQTLAKKANTKPACPVCLCEFTAASKENPHPNSPYHDELISRSDPKNKKECVDCGDEPTLICKDGCGLFCVECQEKFHSKRKATAAHKVVTLLEVGSVQSVNLRGCILHNLPITSICNKCWPVSEMCAICGFEDLKVNTTHKYTEVEKIEYESIKEDNLIETLQQKIGEVDGKVDKVDIEMKKITQEEEKQIAKIEKLHCDIVQKATQLKARLTKMVQETFRPKSDIIDSLRHQMEASRNILKHSISMLREAKDIYQREKIVTKLFKSSIFAKKAIELEIGDVETIEVGDFEESVSFDGDILIDCDGARLLEKTHETMQSEYVKCVQEIGQLKKTNDEWQKQMDEKDTKLKNADERIQILEKEIAEYRKKKESLAEIEKEREENRLLREKMAKLIFNRAWAFNIKDYKFQGKIGSNGNGNQQFNNPWGIAVHPKSGHIYVAEYSNNRVQVLDENLNFVRAFGSSGSSSGQLNGPFGISISSDGLIAVCESGGRRVQIFDEKNTVIATIQSGQKKSQRCTQTTDFDGFSNPLYISFDVEGNIYVANNSKNRVDKFNRDFEFECSFAQSSLGDTGVSSVMGVCVNSKNEVCVAGYGGDQINFYTTNGNFIRTLKIQKVSGNISITEGPSNTIIVSDSVCNQVRAYDSTNGSLIHTFGSSQPSTVDGLFNYPTGICFGLNQKLYVCDKNNHRIQMLSA